MTESVELYISSEMADAITLIARSEDATAGEIIRDAIRRDLRRRATIQAATLNARRTLDPLRSLLKPDFETSQDWAHLQSRLMDKGYRLLQGRGDLIVHRSSGERICSLSELEQSQVALARKFNSSFEPHKAGMDMPQALAG